MSKASPTASLGTDGRVETKAEKRDFDSDERNLARRDKHGDDNMSHCIQQGDGSGGDNVDFHKYTGTNSCRTSPRACGGIKRERSGSEEGSDIFGDFGARSTRPRVKAKEEEEEEEEKLSRGVKREVVENEGSEGFFMHGNVQGRVEGRERVHMGASDSMEGAGRGEVKKEKGKEENEKNARENWENSETEKKISIGNGKCFGKGKGKGKGKGRRSGRVPLIISNDDDNDDNDVMDQEEPQVGFSLETVKKEKRRSSESDSESGSSEYYSSSDSCLYYYSSSEEEEEEEGKRKGKQARKVKREGKGKGRKPLPPPLKKGADGRTLKFKIRGRGEGAKWDDEDTGALVEALRLYPCGDRWHKKYTLPKRGNKLHGRHHAISLYIADTTGILRSEKQVRSRLMKLRKEYGNAIPGLVAGEEVADPWGDPAVNAALVEAAGLYPPCGKERFRIEGGGDRKYGRNEAIARYIEVKTSVKKSRRQVANRLDYLKKKNADDPVLGNAAYDAADPDVVDPWGDPAVNAALVEAAELYPPCGNKLFRIDGAGDKKYGRNEAIARYIEVKTGVTRTSGQVAARLETLKKKNEDDPVLGHAAYDAADPDVVDPWGDPAVNAALVEAAGLYPPCGKKLFKIEGGGDRKYGRLGAIARYIELKTGIKRSRQQVAGRLKNLKNKDGDDPVLGHAAYDAVDPDVVDPWGDPEVNAALIEAAGLYPPCGLERFRIKGGGDKKYGRNKAIARYIEVKTGVNRSTKQVAKRLETLKKNYGDDPVLGHAAYDAADPDVVDPWGDPAVNAALVEAAGLYPPCGNKKFRIDGAGDRKYGRNEAIARYIEVKTGIKRSNEQVHSRLKYLKKK